jgi:hypothetical protein
MKNTNRSTYLTRFFAEKDLSERTYEVASSDGTPNFIPSTIVIEAIFSSPLAEQKKIGDVIRKIDFANGDVHHFLNHLAGALAISL